MLSSRGVARLNALFLMSFGAVAAVVLSALLREPSAAQQPTAQTSDAPQTEPPAPAGQTYAGSRECAACHFEQFTLWRTSPHSKAFEKLPAKYQADSTCLKCHSTGHGDPTGFKSLKETPNLAGNTCEGCHGPGSKHVEVAKSFGQKRLSPPEQAQVRDSIYKMQPKNVCAECHMAATHRKHVTYDK
jgi:hypothetical protein